jgi:hypothetical protein
VRVRDQEYWIPSRDIDALAEVIAEQQGDLYDGTVCAQPVGWAPPRRTGAQGKEARKFCPNVGLPIAIQRAIAFTMLIAVQ